MQYVKNPYSFFWERFIKYWDEIHLNIFIYLTFNHTVSFQNCFYSIKSIIFYIKKGIFKDGILHCRKQEANFQWKYFY